MNHPKIISLPTPNNIYSVPYLAIHRLQYADRRLNNGTAGRGKGPKRLFGMMNENQT